MALAKMSQRDNQSLCRYTTANLSIIPVIILMDVLKSSIDATAPYETKMYRRPLFQDKRRH